MAKKPQALKPKQSDVLKTLQEVYSFMNQNGLDAIEIGEEGALIKLVRRSTTSAPQIQQYEHQLPSNTYAQAPVSQINPIKPKVNSVSGETIKSPMMGIFYRAPSPSSPPFCKEGDSVKQGQVICMVEAMKVFNEIKAEFPCTIVKSLVENGKPVKAGQDLIVISK